MHAAGSGAEGVSDGATSVLQALQQQLSNKVGAGGAAQERGGSGAARAGRALQTLTQLEQPSGSADAAESSVDVQESARKLQALGQQSAATAAAVAAAGNVQRRPPLPRPRPRPRPPPPPGKCPDLPANSLDAAEAVLSANFGVLYSDLLWGIKEFNLQSECGGG